MREEALLAAEEREEERSQLLSEVEAKQMALEGAELKAMASSSSIRSARAQAQKQEDTALAFRDELKQRDESLAQATTALHQARARLEEAMGLASARGEALNEALPKLARAEDLWRGCRAKLQIAEAAAKEYQDANAKRYNDAIKALDRRAKEAARADQVRWKSERARVEAETAASTAAPSPTARRACQGSRSWRGQRTPRRGCCRVAPHAGPGALRSHRYRYGRLAPLWQQSRRQRQRYPAAGRC